MKTIIRSTIAALGVLAAASTSLPAGAETFVFSGKNASGLIQGSNGSLYLLAEAFENTSSSKSNKSGNAGAYVYGSYYTGTECWDGWGSTDAIKFKATGSPKQINASGTVTVMWYEYCSGLYPAPIVDTVTFNQNLTAIRDQENSNWGTSHYESGNYKYNYHYDYSSTPASFNDSSLSSQYFGQVSLYYGYVGRSKSHEVQIIK